MEGGRQRLSCRARNDGKTGVPARPVAWGGFGRGRKSRPAVAGIRARPSAASSASGQTSHIEDADRRAGCRNDGNEDAGALSASPPTTRPRGERDSPIPNHSAFGDQTEKPSITQRPGHLRFRSIVLSMPSQKSEDGRATNPYWMMCAPNGAQPPGCLGV